MGARTVRILLASLLLVATAIAAIALWEYFQPVQAPPPRPANFRVEIANPGAGWSLRDLTLLLTPLATAAVAALAVWASISNTTSTVGAATTNAKAERARTKNQAELERLEGIISTFHVPFLTRSEANSNMAQDLRARLKDPNYRMLVSLFNRTWLASIAKGDQTLVREICANGLRLRQFIEENGGVVDPGLSDHLARASTHFRVLWLAYGGKLGDDPAPFQRYVYPYQLDPAIRLDLERLQKRCADLRAALDADHPPIEPLNLPAEAQLAPWPNPPRAQISVNDEPPKS